MDRADLEKMREWASAKLATGQEPPWAWYQYMKLRETLDAIIDGFDATTQPPGGSPGSEQHSGTHLRLVADSDRQETVRLHRDQPSTIPLPM